MVLAALTDWMKAEEDFDGQNVVIFTVHWPNDRKKQNKIIIKKYPQGWAAEEELKRTQKESVSFIFIRCTEQVNETKL